MLILTRNPCMQGQHDTDLPDYNIYVTWLENYQSQVTPGIVGAGEGGEDVDPIPEGFDAEWEVDIPRHRFGKTPA